MLHFNFLNAMGQNPGITQKPQTSFMDGSSSDDPFGASSSMSGVTFNHTGDIAAKGDTTQDPTAPDFKTFNYAHPAADKLGQLLSAAPQQADYKPSVGRRIASVIAGAAGGYAAGPKAGLDIGSEINEQPWAKAMTSFKTNVQNAETSTELENSNIAQAMKQQELQTANQKWTANYLQDALKNKQQAKYQGDEIAVRSRANDIAGQRADQMDTPEDRMARLSSQLDAKTAADKLKADAKKVEWQDKLKQFAEKQMNPSQNIVKAIGDAHAAIGENPDLADYIDFDTNGLPQLSSWKWKTPDPTLRAKAQAIVGALQYKGPVHDAAPTGTVTPATDGKDHTKVKVEVPDGKGGFQSGTAEKWEADAKKWKIVG